MFDILRVRLERLTGTDVKHGGLYHLVGSIEGVYRFDLYRVARNYVRIMIPLEHRDGVEFGKVYNLRLDSIEEVPLNEEQRRILSSSKNMQYRPLLYRINRVPKTGKDSKPETLVNLASEKSTGVNAQEPLDANFSVVARLQRGRIPRPYFRIANASFQRETGIAIEEGESYKIHGEIKGVGSFVKRLRSLAARQDIPFYVPAILKSKITVGASYSVKIHSMEKIASHETWRFLDGIPGDDWTWRDVAIWIDTEGSIHADEFGSRYLRIGQKDEKVIQQICAFFRKHSIVCSMFLDENTGVYYASVDRTDHIAWVIKNVEPFIRTENKKREIVAFKRYLAMSRKRLQAVIIEARQILGVGESVEH